MSIGNKDRCVRTSPSPLQMLTLSICSRRAQSPRGGGQDKGKECFQAQTYEAYISHKSPWQTIQWSQVKTFFWIFILSPTLNKTELLSPRGTKIQLCNLTQPGWGLLFSPHNSRTGVWRRGILDSSHCKGWPKSWDSDPCFPKRSELERLVG